MAIGSPEAPWWAGPEATLLEEAGGETGVGRQTGLSELRGQVL